jgi:hypothetical protein
VHLPVPKYKEISMKSLYDSAINDDEIKQYLPDIKNNGKMEMMDRDFFFGIISTIKEEETRNFIK